MGRIAMGDVTVPELSQRWSPLKPAEARWSPLKPAEARWSPLKPAEARW
jgi:hypothetical protein